MCFARARVRRGHVDPRPSGQAPSATDRVPPPDSSTGPIPPEARDDRAAGGRPGEGLLPAIALLTATLAPNAAGKVDEDDELQRVLPEDCIGLIELFVGVSAIAHLLLLEISALTGEPTVAPLQRLALTYEQPSGGDPTRG
jgi:hypothetical protein